MNPLSRSLFCLEGLSIGDAFGQCFFQLPDPDSYVEAQRLPDPPWLYTDDTEMSLSVVSSLAKLGRIDQAHLAHSFAQRYDYNRAYGPSMHRVLERIRHGEPWREVAGSSFSGQGSWGNGAAMRSAPIGAYFADDESAVVDQATLSAEITHSHPEGIAGAVAVALAAALAVQSRVASKRPNHAEFLDWIVAKLPSSEVRSKLIRARDIASDTSLQFAVAILGNGTDMSAQDTVPFALWCCAQRLESFQEALWLAVSAGGDRDTICAIVGGVTACYAGLDGIPGIWKTMREALPTWHTDN